METTLSLKLLSPITVGDVTVQVMNLSEPTGEQLATAELIPGPIASIMRLISENGTVPMSVVVKMRQRDLQRAADFFAAFSAPEKTTSGTKSSGEPGNDSAT